jgi:hypothetical protein
MFEVILIISLINGLVSPLLTVVMALAPVWMPEIVPMTGETVFYGASLIIAFATLLIAGVPAALYERFTGTGRTPTSMGIWTGTALVLTLPALSRLF